MTAAQIKRLLQVMGIRQVDICRKWKAPGPTVSALVNRKFKSDRLERRLARLLNVSVEELRGPSIKEKESISGFCMLCHRKGIRVEMMEFGNGLICVHCQDAIKRAGVKPIEPAAHSD